MSKKPGTETDFATHRDRELMQAYRRCLDQAEHIVLSRVFAIVAQSPASRFWVSEERAAILVARMIAGKPLPKMRPNKREMFREIYRRVLIERQKDPHLSLYALVSRVVLQPAPKHYLTPRTVGEYIYRLKTRPSSGAPALPRGGSPPLLVP